MILTSLLKSEVVVKLPRSFNHEAMRKFIGEAIHAQSTENTSKIYFDFSELQFIEPEGVVALSNTIAHFRVARVKVFFRGHNLTTPANRYLDDSGFYKQYLGKSVFVTCNPRPTTVPLEFFRSNAYIPYLYNNLTPWISRSVNLSSDTLETIKTCLEEIFHNIDHHSGVDNGCTFSQFFPKKDKISIAISDFGIGIPTRVRTKLADLSDPEAIREACKEGFTTKTNVRNRGAGLPNLIRYVTQRNSGTVLIHSGQGYLSATRGPLTPSITSRRLDWAYPGTLVQVVLRTNTMERLEADVEPEDFSW